MRVPNLFARFEQREMYVLVTTSACRKRSQLSVASRSVDQSTFVFCFILKAVCKLWSRSAQLHWRMFLPCITSAGEHSLQQHIAWSIAWSVVHICESTARGYNVFVVQIFGSIVRILYLFQTLSRPTDVRHLCATCMGDRLSEISRDSTRNKIQNLHADLHVCTFRWHNFRTWELHSGCHVASGSPCKFELSSEVVWRTEARSLM